MIKSALAIYNRLLQDGEFSIQSDAELFMEYKKDEVRDILYQFEDELKFRLLEAGQTIYMIPDLDNDVLGYVMRELRESISSNAKMQDAYLQVYICMTIFHLFYGGKNTNPIRREFIQTKDLVDMLDQKMGNYLSDEEETSKLEESYSINFLKIALLWSNKQIGDSKSRTTKLGTLARSYALLEKEKLCRIINDGKEIRRTKKLDDLFVYYYLDESRVQDIQQLFRKEQKDAEI